VIIRYLPRSAYQMVWERMRDFTENRSVQTTDEFWLVEHEPVFTQGQAGQAQHVLTPGTIPLIQSDRGGQVTYHGPGQLIIYTLLDLKRKALHLKALVHLLEQSIIALLDEYAIKATTRPHAPGVYVNEAKIASLGLRIRKGYSYHGLSLNVAMDLEPFSRINPCGYPGLKIVQMQDFEKTIQIAEVAPRLLAHLSHFLGYTVLIEKD